MNETDDELASAYLDDTVTAEERARVDGDATLRGRVDELRVARDAVASSSVEPPSADIRDAAIRAAVDASNVIQLGARRGRRQLRIASIAAAALLVLGAVGLLIRSRSDSSQTAFTAVGNSLSSSSATTALPANAELSAA